MGRVVEKKYLNTKDILKFPSHSVQVSVTVDQTVGTNVDGRKIAKAGTIIGGKGGSTLKDASKPVEKKNTQSSSTGTTGAGVDAEGVLLYDVDVTDGAMEGAMLVHGFVDSSKLPEAPCEAAKTALKQITFLV